MMIEASMITLLMMGLIELLLLTSLYLSYQIIQDMKGDLDYSVTRIFLSKRSVRGLKVLMASLMSYAILNLISVLITSGDMLMIGLRANLIVLFGGLTYFFLQISTVTSKTE